MRELATGHTVACHFPLASQGAARGGANASGVAPGGPGQTNPDQPPPPPLPQGPHVKDDTGAYNPVLGYNKYYVDEIYAKVFVKPLVDGSTSILWQGVDRKVIDDTVNNAADGARQVSDEVRHMQSGNLRSYAGWIAAGAAVVMAYMVWLGVR